MRLRQRRTDTSAALTGSFSRNRTHPAIEHIPPRKSADAQRTVQRQRARWNDALAVDAEVLAELDHRAWDVGGASDGGTAA